MKKKGLFLAPAIFAVAVMSLAQVSTEPATANSPGQPAASKPQNPAPPSDTLAPGTLLAVELSKSLDARKTKANDRVEARTASDILAHGRIVVPRNTKIVGHVTEAKAHSKDSPDSKVGVTFDRMLLKDGREVPLQLAVQAIARPLQFGSSAEGNVPPANREGRVPMPGRAPLGDASTSGDSTSNLAVFVSRRPCAHSRPHDAEQLDCRPARSHQQGSSGHEGTLRSIPQARRPS